MSVRAINAKVSIKSGVNASCTIGRGVIVEVHDDVNLQPLVATDNGEYHPEEGVDGYSQVTVDVPPTIPDISPLTVTEDGVYTSSGDGYNPVTVNTGVGALRQEIASAETASGCSPLTEGLTALTTYANEVTGAEDETLSDAVETLASEYGKAEFNPFAQMYTGANLFTSAVLPENLTIDFEGNTVMQSMNSMFRLCTGLKNLTLKNLNPSIAAPIETIFGWSSLETVTFDNCNIAPRSIAGWVRNSNIRHVYGEIDMSSCNSATVFVFQCPNLETFSFKPNTINTAIQAIQNCPLSDDSLISLGNGLVQGASKSMSGVDNRHKTRMNTILGNNVDGTFIADENGSMSLMDFITTVKGWTVT